MLTFHARNHSTGTLEPIPPDLTIPCDRSGCREQMVPVNSGGENRSYQGPGFTRVNWLVPRGVWQCSSPYGIVPVPDETHESKFPHEFILWECPKGHRASTVDGTQCFHRQQNKNATRNAWGQPYWDGFRRAG